MSVSSAPVEIEANFVATVNATPHRATAQAGCNSSWPIALLFGFGLAFLYFSDIRAASVLWSTDEMYQHGWFIFPIAALLVLWRKDEIARAKRSPEWIGLIFLGLGLSAWCASYTMRIPDVGMWSIVPSIAGAVLALHGKALWRIVGFAVCFLIFAGPLPGSQVATVSGCVQKISTTGAAFTSSTIGYPLQQHGNYIELPQGTLEVADVCSGFKKLTSFLAFGCLYAYLFAISPWRRLAVVLSAIPISILANIVRITGLIAVTSAGGIQALDKAHNPAEYVVLVLGFGLFVLVGRWFGCDRIRF